MIPQIVYSEKCIVWKCIFKSCFLKIEWWWIYILKADDEIDDDENDDNYKCH